jgi:sugar O-acyltransferase (sialic acid O-acetyltransferase NeuD family)
MLTKCSNSLGLAIFCAGGYGREVYDSAIRSRKVSMTGHEIIFVDDNAAQINLDKKIKFANVVMTNEFLQSHLIDDFNGVIAVGEPNIRKMLFQRLIEGGVKFNTVIDSMSAISPSAKICNGSIVGPFVSIQANVFLGENVAINSASVIGHDAVVMAHSVISSQANLGGRVLVGESTYIGMGALIKEGVNIGSNVIVGMGAVVYQDIPDGVIVLGNPARVIRRNDEKRVFK